MTWEDVLPKSEIGAAESIEMAMDDQAFTAFYERTSRPVWAYLARVSGNSALADDLLQESYLRFLGAARWGEGEDQCRRYLFRIATNLLRDHWRRPKHSNLDDLPEEAWGIVESRDSERLDSQSILGPALVRMKPRERQLLWLAYAEGCSHREIAEITGLASASIRLLLFRAKQKMARFLRQTEVLGRRNP
ncbi:MAG TPA: sigma-70 family RNA polymerase sigma factor [Candidatus Angelobacter sp.]|nr:sigma-70 family RNA polymerase sigma factor [Candidatus Angelobacter sp.]